MRLIFDESLHDLFPEKTYDLEASTPLDALKLMAENHPLLGKVKPRAVRIKQFKEFDLLLDPSLQSKTFEVIPVDKQELNQAFYGGSGGDNGVMNIVIGIVIVVAVVVTAGAAGVPIGAAGATGAGAGAAGAATATFSLSAMAVNVGISIGVSLILTGLMQLLAPKPEKEESRSSRKFGTTTTTELGTPIQIIFGLHRVYFHLISFNVNARDYDGIDDPDNSPYFKAKVDERLPTVNLNKFYGVYQAGNETKLLQVDNDKNRTGLEY